MPRGQCCPQRKADAKRCRVRLIQKILYPRSVVAAAALGLGGLYGRSAFFTV